MAIGTQQTAPALNALLVALVDQQDKWAMRVAALQAYVTQQGQAGLEGLAIPFTAADAASFIQAVSYINTPALVWTGAGSQPTDYNFSDQLHRMTGPSPT